MEAGSSVSAVFTFPRSPPADCQSPPISRLNTSPTRKSILMLLGDWLAETFKKMGLPACFQCKERQVKLNQLHQKVKDFFTIMPTGSSGPPSAST